MNKNYGILALAVTCELCGSVALKKAPGQPAWLVLTLVADGIAFWLLSVLLRRGMPLSVAYGLWGAAGVALTALMGTVVFGEPFTLLMGCGIALVIAGVLLVEFGADHHEGGGGAAPRGSSVAPVVTAPAESRAAESRAAQATGHGRVPGDARAASRARDGASS